MPTLGPRALPGVVFAAALGAALMAGLLFAFSNFVMRALSQMSPAAGMEAMQRINVEIINPAFLAIFFGTPVLCVLVVLLAPLGPSSGRAWLWAGAAFYLLGVLGVTMAFNVPLNNSIASLPPSAAPMHWPAYVSSWLRWNHVRTVCALLSAGLLAAGGWSSRVPQ